MIHAIVDIGDKTIPLKGKDWEELKERIEKAQSDPKKTGTSYVTRSGKRVVSSREE